MLGFRLQHFFIDAAVTPAVVKESLNDRLGFLPLGRRHSNNPRKLAVVLRQAASGPVFHDEKKIRAMLCWPQPPRVTKVIRDVKRHPGSAQAVSIRVLSFNLSAAGIYQPTPKRFFMDTS